MYNIVYIVPETKFYDTGLNLQKQLKRLGIKGHVYHYMQDSIAVCPETYQFFIEKAKALGYRWFVSLTQELSDKNQVLMKDLYKNGQETYIPYEEIAPTIEEFIEYFPIEESKSNSAGQHIDRPLLGSINKLKKGPIEFSEEEATILRQLVNEEIERLQNMYSKKEESKETLLKPEEIQLGDTIRIVYEGKLAGDKVEITTIVEFVVEVIEQIKENLYVKPDKDCSGYHLDSAKEIRLLERPVKEQEKPKEILDDIFDVCNSNNEENWDAEDYRSAYNEIKEIMQEYKKN